MQGYVKARLSSLTPARSMCFESTEVVREIAIALNNGYRWGEIVTTCHSSISNARPLLKLLRDQA